MKKVQRFLIAALGIASGLLATLAHADYRQSPEAQEFVDAMVAEHGFERAELMALFAKVEKSTSILEAIARPAEKTKSWAEYRKLFLTKERIDQGVAFWREHHSAFRKAERELGVPAEYIVAIIGVETYYGRITGSYRVMDALSTLAFDYPPRSDFFTRELEHYLLLMREHGKDPMQNKGSYAGAMGLGQFMPSSYRSYAIDFDGDDWPDIWNNPTDAIGSVANYFVRHGWQPGAYVAVRARPEQKDIGPLPSAIAKPEQPVSFWTESGLTPVFEVLETDLANAIALDGPLGEEYWLTFTNFYVITRYNRSAMYALAVHQLAQAILRKGSDLVQEDP